MRRIREKKLGERERERERETEEYAACLSVDNVPARSLLSFTTRAGQEIATQEKARKAIACPEGGWCGTPAAC